MTSADDFADEVRLAGELIEKANKDQFADAARLLALSNGYYPAKCGDVGKFPKSWHQKSL
jgi:hypothetical protein